MATILKPPQVPVETRLNGTDADLYLAGAWVTNIASGRESQSDYNRLNAVIPTADITEFANWTLAAYKKRTGKTATSGDSNGPYSSVDWLQLTGAERNKDRSSNPPGGIVYSVWTGVLIDYVNEVNSGARQPIVNDPSAHIPNPLDWGPALVAFLSKLTSAAFWIRAAQVIGGLLLIGLGLESVIKHSANPSESLPVLSNGNVQKLLKVAK